MPIRLKIKTEWWLPVKKEVPSFRTLNKEQPTSFRKENDKYMFFFMDTKIFRVSIPNNKQDLVKKK